MANHSLVLDKIKMQLVCRIFDKYKNIFLLDQNKIKFNKQKHKYILFKDSRYAKLEEKIDKNIEQKFKEDWNLEIFQLRSDNEYKVELNHYSKEKLEAMEEHNFIWDRYNQTIYLDFIYNYPEKNSFVEEYKNKIKERYTIEQRINDINIFYKDNLNYNWENQNYSEFSESFIYNFEELFNIHDIRAWYKMDEDYVFYWWMKDALANYDENFHYDISWNNYKKMCADVYKTKYGSENDENEYFFFRNC